MRKVKDLNTIESIARRYIERKGLHVPVDIIHEVEEMADIIEQTLPGEVDACCIESRGQRPCILINPSISESRRRFTLAHELGHLVIPWHTGAVFCTCDSIKMITDNEYGIMENEANAFAAEIMMPSEYVQGIIKQIEPFDIETAITQISSFTQMSVSAVFYRLVSLLPIGFAFRYHDAISGHNRVIFSQNTSPIELFNDAGEQVDYLPEPKHTEYRNSAFSVKCYQFDNDSSYDSTSYIIEELQKTQNLSMLRSHISDEEKMSAFNLRIIQNLVPKGFVLCIRWMNSRHHCIIICPGSFIRVPSTEKSIHEKVEWFTRNCERYQQNDFGTITMYLWIMKTNYSIIEASSARTQNMTSIPDIVDRYASDTKEKRSLLGQINGTIGSLNNKRYEYSRDEFFSILMQKFRSKGSLDEIMSHSGFTEALAYQVRMLYESDAGIKSDKQHP